MKNNAVFSAALSALIMLGSAAVAAQSADAYSASSYPYGIESAAGAPSAIGSPEKLSFSYGGVSLTVKDSVKKRFAAAYNRIIAGEPLELTGSLAFTKGIYGFIAGYEGTNHVVSKLAGEYGYYLLIDGNYYPVDDQMDKIAAEILPDSSSPADRLLECSVKCSEPKTNDDYIKAAQKCVYQWLDTLSGESGAYKITGYSPYDGGRSDKFIAAGIVGGAKEFAVEVRFDVSGAARGSVFKAPSNSGYNDFYHYYDGSCAFVRCRWEKGVCRIVDYDGAFLSTIGDGLYGVNTSKGGYATFFDFFNDKKAVKSYKEKSVSCAGRGNVVISHNPYMISDGKIFYADIDLPTSRDLTDNKDGTVTGKFGDIFYAEDGTSVYSSPVDYNQAAYEPYELTFTNGFSLVFDDYNCDGNPDFTIKVGENESGSRYRVECIANDGSPRAGRIGTETFVAGRFEDSIRLQNTENGYVTWSKGSDGKLTPSQKVDNYRMYSQRYYLPAQFRGYTNENNIICYFWNNTDKNVKAGGEYSIERNVDGEWVGTGVKGTVKSKTFKPCREAEFSFDISKLTDRPSGEYRIAVKCGKSTVYGGFYISSSAATECSISAESEMLPADRTCISFSVSNTCVNPVRITSAQLLKNGKKVTDIDVSDIPVIASGGKTGITAYAKDDELLGAGKYTLRIYCGKYKFTGGAITLKKFPEERLSYFNGTAEGVLTDSGLEVTLKNNIWSEQDVELTDMITVYVFKDSEWVPTAYALGGSHSIVTVEFGKPDTLKFGNYAAEYLEDEETIAIVKEYLELVKSELDNALRSGDITKDEYIRFKSMDYKDFINEIFGIAELSAGDKCMISLNGDAAENVYFTVK